MTVGRPKFPDFRRRILFLFLISIAFPGVYFSYTGLRAIVKEQELNRNILIQNLERTLEFEIDQFERALEQSERNVARSLEQTDPAAFPKFLEELSKWHPWIEEAFVFDSLWNLRAPLPFLPEPLPAVGDDLVKEISLRSKIAAIEQLELQRDYPTALASLESITNQTSSPQSAVVINTYLARCALADGKPAIARRAYTAVIEADSNFFFSRPISYAGFAWLEIIDDLIEREKLDEALQKLLQFHDRLLEFYFHLSREQYLYLLQGIHTRTERITKELKAATNTSIELSSLDEREQQVETMIDRAQEVQSRLRSERLGIQTPGATDRIIHHSTIVDGKPTRLSLIPSETVRKGSQWVALGIREEEIEREFLLHGLRSVRLAGHFDVSVQKDSSKRSEQADLVSLKMRATASLFPSWRVAGSLKKPETLKIFGIEMPLLSIGLTCTIVAIVLLGIFMIYRDIRREQELSDMKSQFISNVSHELKTPVAAIRMLAENLQEGRVADESRHRQYYQLLSQEGARLSHLIENILDFSRIEANKKVFDFEMHDLSKLVEDSVSQFRSLMELRPSEIDTDFEHPLPQVSVDPEALRLLLFNLFDNAVKYSDKEVQIDVRLRRNGRFVSLEVEDHGCGISKKDQERIFEKFYRGERQSGRKVVGSGIGLTLVKEIAEAHGGTVEVQSELGVGTTFQVNLPIG